jgi:hypothetical protein
MLRQILMLKSDDPEVATAERDAAGRQAEALQAEPQVLTLDDEDDQDPPLTVT